MWGVFLFWLSLATLFYIYVGYPFLIVLLARWRKRPVRKGAFSASISVLVAAHNEEAVIEQKLCNLLSLHGAEHIREIVVGSDGSTDQTVERARSVADSRVHVLDFSMRRGKSAVLNDLMRECTGNIVLMTDARQEIAKDALTALLENFADLEVGVVSGELVFRTEGGGGTAHGVNAYWSYEKRIRKAEAAFHSVPGATGALYAIRRDLLKPIPPETVLDDVVIPMQAVMAGYRCVFEPRALVWDVPSATATQEAVRKRRTLAGNVQLMVLFPQWLCPWRNPIWWQFVSHKILRLFTPFLLAGLLLGSMLAWRYVLYRAAALAQLGLVMITVFSYIVGHRLRWVVRIFRMLGMFYAMQIPILGGWSDVVFGRLASAWKRAQDVH